MRKCNVKNRIWVSITFSMILMIMLFCSGCTAKKEQPTTEAVVKEKPRIKQKKVTIDSEEIRITDYTYNEFGDITLEVTTYGNGDPLFYYENVYDEDGNLLEEYRGKSADDKQIDNRYEYEDGKLMVETVYSFDGSIMDIYYYTYNDEGLLTIEDMSNENLKKYVEITGEPIAYIDSWEEVKTPTIPKVICIDYKHPEKLHELYDEYHSSGDERFENFFSAVCYLEFTKKGTSKGVGVKKLCEILGISPSDCLAIGDEENDIPLIKAVGCGATPANGRDELKAVASYVCKKDNNNGAFAEFIENCLG